MLKLIELSFLILGLAFANGINENSFEKAPLRSGNTETITLGEMIETNKTFPNRKENAWLSENKDLIFLDGEKKMHIKDGVEEFPDVDFTMDETLVFNVEKSAYVLKKTENDTHMLDIIFNTVDGKLSSIDVDVKFWMAEKIGGHYEPQPSIYIDFDGVGGTLQPDSRPIDGFAMDLSDNPILLITEPEIQSKKVIFNVYFYLNSDDLDLNKNKYGFQRIDFDSCYTYDYLEYSLDGGANFTELHNNDMDYDSTFEETDEPCKIITGITGDIILRPKLIVSHELTRIIGKVPTCVEDGWKDYYHCAVCGNLFEDKAGTILINDLETWKTGAGKLVKTGHTLTKVNGKSPTCTEYGWNDYYECSVCGALFEDEAGTSPIDDLETWKTGDGRLVKAAHTLTKVNGQPATCTADGWKDYYKCTVCGDLFEDQAGASPIDDLETWKVGAGKLEATGHHYSGEVTYIWEGDKCTASWACNHTGCSDVQTEEATLENGKTVYVKDSDATTTSNEKGHYVATFTIQEFGTVSTETNSIEVPNTMLPKEGLSGGAIAGISIGSVVLVGAGTYVGLYVLWEKKNIGLKFLFKSFTWIKKVIFKQ